MFKPMFALHKDASGSVIAANSFKYEYDLTSWLRDRDFRAGDILEFREAKVRPEFDEVEPIEPAFIAEPPPTPVPAEVGDDLTF